MKGHIPRPCWNRCGVQIVHKLDGGAYAWVETATGQRHKCTKQPRRTEPKPLPAGNPWESHRGRTRLRMGMTNADLQRGIRIVGAEYRPHVCRPECTAAPWEECDCGR